MQHNPSTGGAGKPSRRPSGFEHSAKKHPAPAAPVQGASTAAQQAPQKEKKERKRPEKRRRTAETSPKRRRGLKIFLGVLVALLILYGILALAFGGGGTVHQLPTVVQGDAQTLQTGEEGAAS